MNNRRIVVLEMSKLILAKCSTRWAEIMTTKLVSRFFPSKHKKWTRLKKLWINHVKPTDDDFVIVTGQSAQQHIPATYTWTLVQYYIASCLYMFHWRHVTSQWYFLKKFVYDVMCFCFSIKGIYWFWMWKKIVK